MREQDGTVISIQDEFAVIVNTHRQFDMSLT